jgi:hypothetical protein
MPKSGQSDYDPGYVYIARSEELGRGKYKIGLSRNVGRRMLNLAKMSYGGFTDWRKARAVRVTSMRAVERRMHKVAGEPVEISTEGGKAVEIFEIPYPRARNMLLFFGRLFRPGCAKRGDTKE